MTQFLDEPQFLNMPQSPKDVKNFEYFYSGCKTDQGTRFRIECLVPMALEVYNTERFTAAFLEHQCGHLGLQSVEEVDSWEDEHFVYKRMATIPVGLPSVVKPIYGDAEFKFHDVVRLDKHCEHVGQRMAFETTPPMAADRSFIGGCITLVPIDRHHCMQIMEGHVQISMFGCGSLLESAVVNGLRDTYSKIPHMVATYSEKMRGGECGSEGSSRDTAVISSDDRTASDSDAGGPIGELADEEDEEDGLTEGEDDEDGLTEGEENFFECSSVLEVEALSENILKLNRTVAELERRCEEQARTIQALEVQVTSKEDTWTWWDASMLAVGALSVVCTADQMRRRMLRS